jgi:hypothetical protein
LFRTSSIVGESPSKNTCSSSTVMLQTQTSSIVTAQVGMELQSDRIDLKVSTPDQSTRKYVLVSFCTCLSTEEGSVCTAECTIATVPSELILTRNVQGEVDQKCTFGIHWVPRAGFATASQEGRVLRSQYC